MDTNKIIAILNNADPLRNSNYQERQVALKKAHEAMDSQGLSYASLGYSQADAERIENQFSASTGRETGNTGKSRTGFRWNPFSRNKANDAGEAKPKSETKAKQTKRTSDGNGCEWNPATGNWEYTADRNGNAKPYQCNYEAPQDYQGSVPVWDGYNGD